MTQYSRFRSYFWSTMGIVQALALFISMKVDAAPSQTASEKSEQSEKVTIGIARMSDISKESRYFKEIEKKLVKMQSDLQKKVEKLNKDIGVKAKQLQSLAKSNVNAKSLQKKQSDLQGEINKENLAIQKEQAKIQSVQQGHMMEIYRQLRLIFKSLGEKHGLTIVMDSEAALFYNRERTMDLTQEAIDMLNSVQNESINPAIKAKNDSK